MGPSSFRTKIAIDEVIQAHKDGILEEAFGTGTAAVISPVGELIWQDETLSINNGETGKSQKLYDTITGIQKALSQTEFGWTTEVAALTESK